MKILVTPTSFNEDNKSEGAMRLLEFADEVAYNNTGKPLEGENLIDRLKDCDGIVAGLDYITKDVIDECEKLKIISRYGAGYDRVDIAEASKRNIKVTNTPGANKESVADFTIGLILSVARGIPYLDKQHKEGKWVRHKGVEIHGKKIGIVGLGEIGKSVAKRAQGFSMKVLSYDPYMNIDYAKENNIKSVKLDELIRESDVITLHLPLTQATRHLINKESIENMKDGVIIVNTSRGGIIDEDAALEGIKSGKIQGLGLDVYEMEPPNISKFLDYDNVVLTPHAAAHTKEASQNMLDVAVDNIIKVLSREDCANIVK